MYLEKYLNPINEECLRDTFRSASPFPFVCIDDFLRAQFAHEVAAAFPSFDLARCSGHEFRTLNEARKVQITDEALFPAPIRTLRQVLACPSWLQLVSMITGIPAVVADEKLTGGGIHIYGPGAYLDVHVDFNRIAESKLHRRLNLLLFLNPQWSDLWGGQLELWSSAVSNLEQSLAPKMNRCVLFATTKTSFHGVAKVSCPPGISRNSFAGYYYTAEPSEDCNGRSHSTIFRARPGERFKGSVLMPLERLLRAPRARLRALWCHLRRPPN